MTEESCVSFCDSQGYYFAGVEYSDECCELDNPVPAVCMAPRWARLIENRLRQRTQPDHTGTQYGLPNALRRQLDRGLWWPQPPQCILERQGSPPCACDEFWPAWMDFIRMLH
jgi:hypothetical protein